MFPCTAALFAKILCNVLVLRLGEVAEYQLRHRSLSETEVLGSSSYIVAVSRTRGILCPSMPSSTAEDAASPRLVIFLGSACHTWPVVHSPLLLRQTAYVVLGA